ncbi:MAG: ppsA, partial [Armatimonadetes bacterium]|nr:ppsA [Armatimonadota bacterium]
MVTAGAFRQFLENSDLRQVIAERLASLNVDDTTALQQASSELQERVAAEPFPEALRRDLKSIYAELGRRCEAEAPFVAVRSSATAEDMPGTSFAGMNETFLNVRGEAALQEAIRGCWASLYGARVLFYRRKQGIPEEKIAIAVVVQAMVDSDAAGVMFTLNPTDGDRSKLVIEGALGFGDTVVSGAVSPDHWEVDKETLAITGERLAEKHVLAYRDAEGRNQRREPSPKERSQACLTPDQVRQVADLGRRIEAHYGTPQDVEWAVAGGQISIVQSRPVTAVGSM